MTIRSQDFVHYHLQHANVDISGGWSSGIVVSILGRLEGSFEASVEQKTFDTNSLQKRRPIVINHSMAR